MGIQSYRDLVTTTGSTTARTLADRFADVVNVKDFGAVGDGATDDNAAIIAALTAAPSGSAVWLPAGTYIITELSGASLWSGKFIYGPGAIMKRKASAAQPANASKGLVDFTDAKNFTVRLKGVDGNAANCAAAAQNVTAVGCGNADIEIAQVINPLAVTGSYGGGLVWADSDDAADGTTSRIADSKFIATAGDGTYGLTVVRSKNITISGISAKGWVNAGVSVQDTTLPVPGSPTNSLISGGNFFFDDCGVGLEIFGFRSGVSDDGFDIFAQQFVTSFCSFSQITAINCAIYGVAAQGDGVEVSNLVLQSCGTIGDLYGGLLFQSRGGTASHVEVIEPIGIGVDMGGSQSAKLTAFNIVPGANTEVAINAGAALSPRISNGSIWGGATAAILASGFDGAGADNWMPWIGRDLKLVDVDITMTGASDVGIRVSNAFQGAAFDGVTIHKQHASATPVDFFGAENVDRAGIRVILETNSNPAAWTDRVIVASANTMNIPDYSQLVDVTGTTTINIMPWQGETDAAGKVRSVVANFGSNGSGYSDATVVSFSGGGGTGAAAIPVRSDEKIYGAYITNPGSGYTSSPSATVDVGSGAVLTANVGPPSRRRTVVTLHFADASQLASGAGAGAVGELYLNGGSLTPSAFGLTTIQLIENSTNWLQLGR